MSKVHFDIRLRVEEVNDGVEGIGRQLCPACEAPMTFHQPDCESPHRLLANCSCEECGVWFAVIVRPDERIVYLIRLPSVVEMVEAIARQGRGGDGPPAGNGRS